MTFNWAFLSGGTENKSTFHLAILHTPHLRDKGKKDIFGSFHLEAQI
jgi:predicted alpha/beta-hydrolase family hydrolase